jgi:hypothetical protein
MTAAIALELLKAHWPKLSLGCAILFVFLYIKQAGELSACRASEDDKGVIIAQLQESLSECNSKSMVKGGVRVKPTDKGCPEVSVDFEAAGDGNARATEKQIQYVTITAKSAGGGFGLTLGAAQSIKTPAEFNSANALIGLNYKAFMILGIGNEKDQSVGLAYTLEF